MEKKSGRLFVSDYITDVVAVATSSIALSWSVYILTTDTYRPLTQKKDMVYAIAGILSAQLLINLWMIVREILDNRFSRSEYKWLILVHSVIVVMALIWTIRCVSTTSEDVAWCQQSHKPIFGLLLSTSTIYMLMVILAGPASSRLIEYLRTVYNGKKESSDKRQKKKKSRT